MRWFGLLIAVLIGCSEASEEAPAPIRGTDRAQAPASPERCLFGTRSLEAEAEITRGFNEAFQGMEDEASQRLVASTSTVESALRMEAGSYLYVAEVAVAIADRAPTRYLLTGLIDPVTCGFEMRSLVRM